LRFDFVGRHFRNVRPKILRKTAKIYAKKQKKRRFLLKFLKILQNLRKIFAGFK